MALTTTESTLQADLTGKDVNDKVADKAVSADEGTESNSAEPSVIIDTSDSVETSVRTDTTTDAQSSSPSTRPSLVSSNSTQGQSSHSAPAAPHPKRFSAVNINKKFLEKNIASGASTTTSSTSSNVKVGSSGARATIQPTSSHSKLVAAKLTAGPPVSSTPAGWSRSPSVAPSPAPASNSPNNNSPLLTPATQPSTTTLQSHHINKVTQSQTRTVTQLHLSKESGPTKPVWGNIKPVAVLSLRTDVQANDFPTAAEVANATTSRKQAKSDDTKSPPKLPSKQLRSEEADTFRGVHLDPNAHHWDEMEEDDDNFLNGVIEFGDGRQYTIDTSQSQQPGDSSDVPPQTDDKIEPTVPVSKDQRFVDDFDRSWPKQKESPSSSYKEFPSNNVRSASPKSLSGQSPLDNPRVLFNERSNRLEPYNHSHRQGSLTFAAQKRQSTNEGSVPDSHRGSRDGPQTFQVLRKASGGDNPRSRRFSGSSGGYSPASNGIVGPHRDGRRETPSSPRSTRDHHLEGNFNDRARRPSVGVPPLSASTSQRAVHRQLPPHLSSETFARRLSSQDSQLLSPAEAPRSPSFASTFSGPPQSPVVSHASVSPQKPPYASLPGGARDLEDIRKDVMHDAAERAKARRQLEEKQREEQKERARRKAAELEERIKTENGKLNISSEATDVRPETPLETAESSQPPENTTITSHHARRSSTASRASISLSTAQAESWRARQNASSPKETPIRVTAPDLFSASGPSAVEHVASIADMANDLEVVDFSEMGRLVGILEPSETHSEVSAKSPDLRSWRRKVEVSNDEKDENESISTPRKESFSECSDAPEESTTKEPFVHLSTQGQTVHVPVPHSSPKPPRRPQFISSLDDAMSRIKGVIVGMHSHDRPPGQDSQPKKTMHNTMHSPVRQGPPLWMPPAIRVQDLGGSTEPNELFAMTLLHQPSTPPTKIPVHLPKRSVRLRSIHEKKLIAFNRPPPAARLDVLTFEPPVYEMKKTWSINDALFPGISASFRLNFRYRVVLPKQRGIRNPNPSKQNSAGAFGRPNVADGVTSWRKTSVPVSPRPKHLEPVLENGLNTTTRSPPPEGKNPESVVTSIPKPPESSSSKPDENPPVRARQPKMPEGTSVAFRRDSRIDFVEGSPRPLVNFIVSSEIDEAWSQTPTVAEPGVTTTSRVVHSPLAPKSELKQEPSKPGSNGLLVPGTGKEISSTSGDGKTANELVVDGLTTPPNHTSPWMRSSVSLPVKESPSRAPDPEHLKALWSQPSSKVDAKPVNSLEGIADDLPSLPFVLPDAKSSDGTTPSPSLSAAPSRMSIHEVTRAFQQVPASSVVNPSPSRDKAQISPPKTNAPVARPAPISPAATTYAYPKPQNNLRPVYAPYPPMLTPSPAPVMYGHMTPNPVQNRVVNGHPPPMYNAWMSPSQSSATMMRPMPSYPTMVPYGPGYAQPGNGANMMPQTQGAGRPVGMPMLSPVLSPVQAHPYGGSPVLMPQNHGYMPMQADRVQPLRTDNGHVPLPPPSHSHPQTHAGFNPGPQSSFPRSSW